MKLGSVPDFVRVAAMRQMMLLAGRQASSKVCYYILQHVHLQFRLLSLEFLGMFTRIKLDRLCWGRFPL
jgi:hypothetical protein